MLVDGSNWEGGTRQCDLSGSRTRLHRRLANGLGYDGRQEPSSAGSRAGNDQCHVFAWICVDGLTNVSNWPLAANELVVVHWSLHLNA